MIEMKMSEGGRVVVPLEIRKALGLKEGDTVLWELAEGAARLTTRAAGITRAQALFQRYIPPREDRSLADELAADRRAEAAAE